MFSNIYLRTSAGEKVKGSESLHLASPNGLLFLISAAGHKLANKSLGNTRRNKNKYG